MNARGHWWDPKTAISYLVRDPKTHLFSLFRRQEMTSTAPVFPGSGSPSPGAARTPSFLPRRDLRTFVIPRATPLHRPNRRYRCCTKRRSRVPRLQSLLAGCEKVLLQRRFMGVAIACFKRIKKYIYIPPFEFKRLPMNTGGFTDYQSSRLHSSCSVNSRPYALPELGCLYNAAFEGLHEAPSLPSTASALGIFGLMVIVGKEERC